MTTQMIIAQCLMVLTLIIMITGKTPLYLTAIVGAAVSAIVAGYPIAGSAPMTVGKMINMGLNPVIDSAFYRHYAGNRIPRCHRA